MRTVTLRPDRCVVFRGGDGRNAVPGHRQRGGPRWPSLAVLAIIAATSACGDHASPDCSAALRRRTSGEPRCPRGDRCAEMARHPDRRLSFSLGLEKAARDDDRQRNWQCVADFLKAHGVTEIERYSDSGDLYAEATYSEIRPAMDLSLVNQVDPGCRTAQSCLDCAALGENQCATDPFCMPIAALPFDPEHGCVGPRKFFGCQHQDKGCPAAIVFNADASGACWQYGGCGPAGLTPQGQCEPKIGAPPFPVCVP